MDILVDDYLRVATDDCVVVQRQRHLVPSIPHMVENLHFAALQSGK